jgi:hypothetical protein
MTFIAKTLGKLSIAHLLHSRSERLIVEDIEKGEAPPASPNDPDYHGSFEWLFDTTSSVTSQDSNDLFVDVLEEAESVCLTIQSHHDELDQCRFQRHWERQTELLPPRCLSR